ncbi:MAG: regulatory protein RecX [Ignavibacteria bacterium]
MIFVEKVERKGNKIQVTFSDSTILKLSSDVYKKFPISAGEELDESFIELIKKENEYFEVKKSALRFLSIRNHSSQELYKKLSKKKFSDQIIKKVIDELLSIGYLNDKKFAEQYLSELTGKLFGPLKIKNEMIKRGIAKEIIDDVLSDYFNNDEIQKEVIKNILSKNRFPKKISNRNEMQKIYNYLISRGFQNGIVMEVLKEKMNLDLDKI